MTTDTPKSVIDFLKGKNVFVFDTETTGLPAKTDKWGTYWDYKMSDKYDSSRIVSIAWASLKKFDKKLVIFTFLFVQILVSWLIPIGF